MVCSNPSLLTWSGTGWVYGWNHQTKRLLLSQVKKQGAAKLLLILNSQSGTLGPAGTQSHHQLIGYQGSSQHGGRNHHCTRSLGYAGAAICLHVSSTSNADPYETLHDPKEGHDNC